MEPIEPVVTCPNINQTIPSEYKRNSGKLTKKQIYSKAVRGQLNAQGITTFASQSKYGTFPNVYNLQKLTNSNVLIFSTKNCSERI
jgi:hypothetical protein